MIGREQEKRMIFDAMISGRPEFLAVYGRRRVGKTYLIREFFQDQFAFYATGVPRTNTRQQLRFFHESLSRNGDSSKTIPRDWIEAFSRLQSLLSQPSVKRDCQTGRRIVFLDELPWMDTAKSDFRSALDYFWNSWASAQKDLMLIVCGSATSWMITNLVMDTGGFYNRVTRHIHLAPFTLRECELLLQSNGMKFTRRQVIESYMIFGGIPYYLNYMRPQLSLAQNVDMLLFQENGPLCHEYEQLFASLFKKADQHISIIEALSKRRSGMSRDELLNLPGIPQGKQLTKCLDELEKCGFVRKYSDFPKKDKGMIYQLIDSLTLFYLTWMQNRKTDSWLEAIGTPSYYAWCGLAFERVCLLHTKQLKTALGISGISSQEYSWRSERESPGVQIDLLIDRKDDVINICEMKYTMEPFRVDASYEQELISKREVFRKETKTDKALHLTLISLSGLKNNAFTNEIVNQLTGDDLFLELTPGLSS